MSSSSNTQNHGTPSILWITTDQQRYDTLGCTGNSFVDTPNIDRLAREGTIFHNAFAQSPYCTPSRAAFLTGRYPRTCGGRQNGADIPAREVLVTKILQDSGYYNGLSGKLHLSAANPQTGRKREPRIDDGYDEFSWSHHSGSMGDADNDYHDWLEEKGLEWKAEKSPESDYVTHAVSGENSQTAWCAEKAVTFMEDRANDGKPWLFSVNMYDPHHAFDPPREHFERYLEKLHDIPLPKVREGELDNKPLWQKTDSLGAYGDRGNFAADMLTDSDRRAITAAYWAMIDLIDEYVGVLIDTLERTGQRENTIVIFTSDHGEMLGDHGIYLKGPYFYDCAIRVPLIISCPGKIPAGECNALVELMDLPQTILDSARMKHHAGMQGKSLWPLLTDEQRGDETNADVHKEDIYCESYHACAGHNGKREQPAFATMLRTREHKLVVAHNLNSGELYDLIEDPDEFCNLWDDPAYGSVKAELLLRLTHRMAFTCDPLPERIAPW